MFKIEDGRESFYQWDLDRKLIVEDASINQVHFCNKTEDCSLVVEVKDGLADVPNELLQSDWNIKVYAYDSKFTKHCATFKVNKRSKPADYIYTPTEIITCEKLVAAAIDEARANGEFKPTDEDIAEIKADVLAEAEAKDAALASELGYRIEVAQTMAGTAENVANQALGTVQGAAMQAQDAYNASQVAQEMAYNAQQAAEHAEQIAERVDVYVGTTITERIDGIETDMGNIDAALEAIIALQNSYINGGA